jgi:hypothetical protein
LTEGARPVGGIGVGDESHRIDLSGVVDDHVEASPRVSRSCDGRAHAAVVGDVARLDAACDAAVADPVGNTGCRGRVAHEQSGRDPAHGQSQRRRGADAARGAGDDRSRLLTAAGSDVQERRSPRIGREDESSHGQCGDKRPMTQCDQDATVTRWYRASAARFLPTIF